MVTNQASADGPITVDVWSRATRRINRTMTTTRATRQPSREPDRRKSTSTCLYSLGIHFVKSTLLLPYAGERAAEKESTDLTAEVRSVLDEGMVHDDHPSNLLWNHERRCGRLIQEEGGETVGGWPLRNKELYCQGACPNAPVSSVHRSWYLPGPPCCLYILRPSCLLFLVSFSSLSHPFIPLNFLGNQRAPLSRKASTEQPRGKDYYPWSVVLLLSLTLAFPLDLQQQRTWHRSQGPPTSDLPTAPLLSHTNRHITQQYSPQYNTSSASKANLPPMSYRTAPAVPARSPLRQHRTPLPPPPADFWARSNLEDPPSEAETAAIKGERVRAELRALFDNRVTVDVNRPRSSSSSYPRFRQHSTSSSDLPPLRRAISLGCANNAEYHSGLHRMSDFHSSSGANVSPLVSPVSWKAPRLVNIGERNSTKKSRKTRLFNRRPVMRKQSTPRLYLHRAKGS
ncbi:hypothetical protein ACRALDRAFT_209848 [Sodiomyces alcalophilus JCM 7366]|uniref:uncharacterized protein n=1 Tax=Sodiomyces alcalophilus JCM 7366 TaxID=591952 RepID=UPI0039B45E1D